jgi:hypothetical protein
LLIGSKAKAIEVGEDFDVVEVIHDVTSVNNWIIPEPKRES